MASLHESRTRPIMGSTFTAAAAFALFALAGAGAHAGSAIAPARAQASVDMRIVVPAFVRVEAQASPGVVPIGEADVARGYVDVDDATSLVLTSNSRSGFAMSVVFDERIVSRVAVRIAGLALEAASQGSALHVQAAQMVAKPLRVGYRLFLARGAVAGTYRWPVILTFGPLAV
ncbi:MAG: hypothetical protein ACXWHB_10720 [Usitatibacter sp.]